MTDPDQPRRTLVVRIAGMKAATLHDYNEHDPRLDKLRRLATGRTIVEDISVPFEPAVVEHLLGLKGIKQQGDIVPGHEDEAYDDRILEHGWRRIDSFEISRRSRNCMQNAGIEYIYQLVEKTERDILKTKDFGYKSLNELAQDLLEPLGLRFGLNNNLHRVRERLMAARPAGPT